MDVENKVFLDRCKYYRIADIVDYLERSSGLFASFPSLTGAKILLKPNLISSRNCRLSCTNPCVIAGVATWLTGYGAKVFVGDSPAFGTASSVLRKLGLTKTLSGLGVDVVEFKKSRRVTCSSGTKLVMAAEPSEYDLLVNLPKIKAHEQLYMTMAVKNFFGLVKGVHKAMLHMSHGHSMDSFASVLVEILSFLPPHLSIADGVEVMHRHGPLNGESLELGALVGAVNPVALDTAVLDMLELDPLKSPTYLTAVKKRMPGTCLSEISFPLRHPSFFHGSSFLAPAESKPLRFHPFRFFASTIRRAMLNRHF